MDNDYVLLMSVYNEIEAENVTGILEIEGIEVKSESPRNLEFVNLYTDGAKSVNIFVSTRDYDRAREIIEVEMVRGDF